MAIGPRLAGEINPESSPPDGIHMRVHNAIEAAAGDQFGFQRVPAFTQHQPSPDLRQPGEARDDHTLLAKGGFQHSYEPSNTSGGTGIHR